MHVYACMYVCLHACMCVYMCACMHACMCVCTYIHICTDVCMHVRTYVCTCVCMYIHTHYSYIHMCTYKFTNLKHHYFTREFTLSSNKKLHKLTKSLHLTIAIDQHNNGIQDFLISNMMISQGDDFFKKHFINMYGFTEYANRCDVIIGQTGQKCVVIFP